MKSLLIIDKCTRSQPPDPGIVIKNVMVSRVDEVILLGHKMCEDIYKFNASKCATDFNRQNNMFLLSMLSMLTILSEMCCFISTVQLFMAARCLQCLEIEYRSFTPHENSCMQGVMSPLDHTLSTSATLGWMYGY